MSEPPKSIDPPRAPPDAPRQPAVVVAVVLALGILADRAVAWITWPAWLATATTVLLIAGVSAWLAPVRPGRMAATSALLVALAALGGARHHAAVQTMSADDVRLFARVEPRLVRLKAIVHESPWIRRARHGPMQASWAQIDHTVCVLDCREILDDGGAIPVSGRARLDVEGHALHFETADEVIVTGWLARAAPPSNPGDFDWDDALRRQGVGCLISSDHPDSVRRLGATSGFHAAIGRTISRLRGDGDALFAQHLSREAAPIASALLLGDRSGITDEWRVAFAQSGMTHVLAISGLNVGILALLAWPLCRLANASARATALALIGTAVGYAALTDANPPVVRATVILVAMSLALPWRRVVPARNALGVAAIVVLLWRPADLLDTGAQLSFLSVAGMIWVGDTARKRPRDALDDLAPSWPVVLLRRGASVVGDSVRLMAAIWIFTLPLVIYRFQLVSPAGLLLNILLIPLITVMLWLGYLTLVLGLLAPAAAGWLAAPFDLGLRAFLRSVEWAAAWRFGHLDVPPPSGGWLAGYYLILAVLFVASSRRRFARRAAMGLAAWTVFGLGGALRTPASDGLRCTFLAVGHGGAVLLELPDGGVVLYDCGSLQNPQRSERAVEAALWARGRRRIDALVVSHADIDHYNGVPGLMERVPVGRIFAARSFLDFRQEMVRECCEAAFRRGVPIRLVREGDRLDVGGPATLRVLHPPDPWETLVRPTDNAGSVVLRIDYAGRRILLTGDLEKEGLSRLLDGPPLDLDVLQAPHHGSLAANPAALARWATPEFVVASSGRRVPKEGLAKAYGERTRVFATSESGATTIEIKPDGAMTVTTLRAANE